MEPDSLASPVNTSEKYSGEEISLIEILNMLLRHRRLLVLLPVLVAVLVGLFTMFQPRVYSASASFIPQVPESRSMSGTAALARQFGVNIGGDRPGGSPQFYADLLKTREILRQVVESKYHITEAESKGRDATLIELYEVKGTASAPAWQKALGRLRKDLAVSVERETGVIKLSISAASPDLAEQILQRLLKLVNDFNLENRQSQAHEEARFIVARMKEVHGELLAAKSKLQAFLQNNRQFRNSPELLFKHDDLQREVAMRQEIYTSLAQSHEQARIDAVRDTPLLTLIDHPEGAAEIRGRGVVLRAIAAFFIAFFVAMLGVFMVEFSLRSNRKEGEDSHEFQSLIREAWDDLRSPSQWIFVWRERKNPPTRA